VINHCLLHTLFVADKVHIVKGSKLQESEWLAKESDRVALVLPDGCVHVFTKPALEPLPWACVRTIHALPLKADGNSHHLSHTVETAK
jgi:hypothetical protein